MTTNLALEILSEVGLIAVRILAFTSLASIAALCVAAGEVFQTRGSAVILRPGAVTIGVEKKDIPIPSAIEVGSTPGFSDVEPDSRKGWTRCRVPMKGDISWQGPIKRELVFECQKIR
jgi:hypothetical protein